MSSPNLLKTDAVYADRWSTGLSRGRITRPVEVKLERICRLCRKGRCGAAAVEFAVVAPVLFLIVFGMIEFGRMVMVQQVITNASREGARVAVLDNAQRVGTATNPGVIDTIQNYLENAAVNPDDATITIDPFVPTDAGYGMPVTVTVSIPFSEVGWIATGFFDNSDKVLTASTVMRRETVQ